MVGDLELLSRLYDPVIVPRAVFEEVTVAGFGLPGAEELGKSGWRSSAGSTPDPLLLQELGLGEAEVITAARELGAGRVILDDLRARRIASIAYGLPVRGTAGVLVEARRRGLIPAVRPLLSEIRSHGYFISDRILERACKAAGE